MKNIRKDRFYPVKMGGVWCYRVKHVPSGKTATFDKDVLLLDKLISNISDTRTSLIPVEKGGDPVMAFGKSPRHGAAISLASMAYAFYHDLSIDEVRKLRIKHVNGTYLPDGSEDCRSCNLAATSEPCLATRQRRFSISPDGQHIKLELTPKGRPVIATVYLSNVPGFLDFLSRPGNFYFSTRDGGRKKKGRRVTAQFLDASGCRHIVKLSRLAHFYYQGMITESNFRVNLHPLDKLFRLDIDHLNSDKHNNTKWNLSSMAGHKNQKEKSDLLARLKPPYYCFPVSLPNGGYRMEIGFVTGWMDGQSFVVECANINSLISCVRSFLDLEKKPAWVLPASHPIEPQGTPTEAYRRNKKAVWRSRDFKKAAETAERLLRWDGEIIRWKDGDSWEVNGGLIYYVEK